MTISIDGTTPSSAGEMMPDDRHEQRAGEAGHAGRDGERDSLDRRRVVAEEAHPVLAVAHGDQQPAVPAVHQLAGEQEDDAEHAATMK